MNSGMVFCFLGFILSGISTARGDEPLPEIAFESPGIEVSHSVRIRQGAYRIPDLHGNGVLIVKADNVTIDFNGAELIGCEEDISPDKFSGFGIVSRGYNNITVKNARIRGFKVAIHIQGGNNIVVESCDVSHNYAMRLKSTPEREDVSDWLWPHNNDNDEWMTNYGGGIVIEDCAKATIGANRGYHSQNGIIFDSTHDSEIYDNDFSFNSGWGLALWRSNRNKVSHNKFDWCVRGYNHGVYARGQDSAGILVFEQCNDNIFAYNSATHGGDGFFLYAGHQTLRQTGEGGCNRNILYGNDFSHAVANGIEATFSDSNYFIENVLNECTYGVWAGYSYNTWVVGNRISDSLNAGIAIEHGHDNVIEGNSLSRNRIGVRLWWDENKDLLNSAYGRKQNTNSEQNLILRNRFENDQIAIALLHTSKTTIEQNAFLKCRQSVKIEDNCPQTVIRDNHEGDVGSNQIDFSIRSRQFFAPEVSGILDAFLPENSKRGRKYMIIDEWGPYDFSRPKLWPETIYAGREGSFYLYGPESEFVVEKASDNVTVEPTTGTTGNMPTKITVRAQHRGLCQFDFNVRVSGEERPLRASGTLLNVEWHLRFYHWEADPRQNQEAWKALLSGNPIDELKTSELNFSWGTGSPSKNVRADYFGTLATTTVKLPQGTYEIRTISDDGIRLWVDGKLIIDNWTWHPPTEDVATVSLEDGEHQFRIEHFEIDGWAALSLKLRPM